MKLSRSNSRPQWLWSILAIGVLSSGVAFLCLANSLNRVYAAQEKESAPRPVGDQSTGLNDQTELNVTVYNSNIALIRDLRQISLPSGAFRLKFMDIAATVNPATVHFRSFTGPE